MMTSRIDSYEDLAEDIVRWIKDYYWDNDLGGLVVGVSGGIDSALCTIIAADAVGPKNVRPVFMPTIFTNK